VLKHLGYCNIFGQLIYKFLKKCNCPPDWNEAEERESISETVNNMLDVIYLQKRIDFLEKSLSLLFKEHQLKALYLLPRKTKSESDENYDKHRLRDRLNIFINRKTRSVKEECREQ
jgi:hypothetical protein